MKQAIDDKKISTKLDKSAQSAHKLNSDAYNKRIANGENPSYTELSNMEIQKIINENSGKGKVRKGSSGQFKETITLDYDFGTHVDKTTGKKTKTNRATIHYSKKGTHLVPSYKKGD